MNTPRLRCLFWKILLSLCLTVATVPAGAAPAERVRVGLGSDENPLPAILELEPAAALAGGTAFTLTVRGSGFVRGAAVRWDGGGRGTTFVSDSELRATIVTADIASAGVADVTVFNPPRGGGESNVVSFTVDNPVPWIHSLQPASVLEGGEGLELVVRGGDFVSTSVVRWDGQDRSTQFVTRGELRAAISAADVAAAGIISVSVHSPAPGGGDSSEVAFAVNHPAPVLEGIDPATSPAGAAGLSLTVQGQGFVVASVVRWEGTDRPTSYVSATQLTAEIPADDLASPGTAKVTVFTPQPGGGESAAVDFTVGYPRPTIHGVVPRSARAGGTAFTLHVHGSDFYRGAVVAWNGSARGTSFVDGTQLRATITLPDIASPGLVEITVRNPAPNAGVSAPHPFLVSDRAGLVYLPVVTHRHLR